MAAKDTYPGRPRVMNQAGIPVINLQGVRLPAGPVAVYGMDSASGRLSVGVAQANTRNFVFFAEMLLLKPLAIGESGFAYMYGQFTPDDDLSAGDPDDFVWLQDAGNVGLFAPANGYSLPDMYDQYVGVLRDPGTGPGTAIVDGWMTWSAYSVPSGIITRPYSTRLTLFTNILSVPNNTWTKVPYNFLNYEFIQGTTWRNAVIAGNGAFSSVGTSLNGLGTNFTVLAAGDFVIAGGQYRIIDTVTNNAVASVTRAFSPDVSGAAWTYQKDPHKLIGPSRGVYSINASMEWPADGTATGVRAMRVVLRQWDPILLSFDPEFVLKRVSQLPGTDIVSQGISDNWDIGNLTEIWLEVFQNSGGTLNINPTVQNTPGFAITKHS